MVMSGCAFAAVVMNTTRLPLRRHQATGAPVRTRRACRREERRFRS